jgi:hypothetical protein
MARAGRSGLRRTRNVVATTSLASQFEQPYGPMGPLTFFTIPVLHYMKTYGLTHEQLVALGRARSSEGRPRPNHEFGYYGVRGLDTMRGGKEVTRAAGILG